MGGLSPSCRCSFRCVYAVPFFEFCHKICLIPVTLQAITGIAKQLQIVEMVRAAFGLWDNVVNREILKREEYLTARANAFLLPEQSVLVSFVGRQWA